MIEGCTEAAFDHPPPFIGLKACFFVWWFQTPTTFPDANDRLRPW